MATVKKKNNPGVMMIELGAIAIICCIVMALGCKTEILASFKSGHAYDIEELVVEDLKLGDTVKGEVYYVEYCYGTMTTTQNNKTTKITEYWLLDYFYDDEWHYLTLEVSNAKDKKALQAVFDDNENGMYAKEPFVFEGCVKKLDSKAYNSLIEDLVEYGFCDSKAEAKKLTPQYSLVGSDSKSFKGLAFCLFGGLIAGIVLLVFGIKTYKKNEAKLYVVRPAATVTGNVVINGISYPKTELVEVNKLIKLGDKESAIIELRNRTALGYDEASQIVSNWNQYYN